MTQCKKRIVLPFCFFLGGVAVPLLLFWWCCFYSTKVSGADFSLWVGAASLHVGGASFSRTSIGCWRCTCPLGCCCFLPSSFGVALLSPFLHGVVLLPLSLLRLGGGVHYPSKRCIHLCSVNECWTNTQKDYEGLQQAEGRAAPPQRSTEREQHHRREGDGKNSTTQKMMRTSAHFYKDLHEIFTNSKKLDLNWNDTFHIFLNQIVSILSCTRATTSC